MLQAFLRLPPHSSSHSQHQLSPEFVLSKPELCLEFQFLHQEETSGKWNLEQGHDLTCSAHLSTQNGGEVLGLIIFHLCPFALQIYSWDCGLSPNIAIAQFLHLEVEKEYFPHLLMMEE